VKQVLVEYEEYLPLTLRQIFYRLVGAHGYEKTEQAYAKLGGHLANARRGGIIPWGHIRDDGLTDLTPTSWQNMGDLLDACVNSARDFRLDRQYNQPRRLFFCIEASGMAPQIGRIADRYGIRVLSSGGFDSLTVKHDLAVELYSHAATEVMHLGDHDASGVHVYSSLKEDVTQMMQDIAEEEDVRWDPDCVRFTRLAVTQEQIRDMSLPTAPPKAQDNRRFAGQTTQVEAIPPDQLAAIVQNAIADRIDWPRYYACLAEEQIYSARLVDGLIELGKQPRGLLPYWRDDE
jgi:hypothetical protein